MKKITEANLRDAFAGESQAHVRYLNFAERALKEGYPNIARVFQAAALSEQVHAGNHLKALGGLGNTVANVETALSGENFEVDEMYGAYMQVADSQGEKSALRSMTWAMEAEKVHARLYGGAKSSLAGGTDGAVTDIWVCGSCGFTMEGEMPDVCPVCGARHERFIKF